MTLTKDIAAKLAVAFVAVAMVFSAFAASAKAQTTEDLQQMINDLLAQVAALQSQVGASAGNGDSNTASFCPYTWTRDLSTGSTGADVMKLQQFLNSDPDTRVAAAGSVGSAGMETQYYGPATAAAVSKFQVKYRADVLSPLGLVNPTGYYGAGTRDKANSLCSSAVVVPDTDDEDEEEEEDEDDSVTLRGEADLKTFETDSASDDDFEEGAEDAEIATVTVEFQNGDAEISRIDLALVGSGDEQDPWDVFESISLWVDGDKIAEMNADDEDDYLDEDDGSLRFSGLDLIGMEDEEVEIVVAATVQNNLDGVSDGEVWVVSFDALRFFDADGVATTDTTTGDLGGAGESFTIEEAGADDEIIVKTSSNDPDATTLQVEDSSKSDWYTVHVFDLDTDDSVNDIEINEITVSVVLSSSTYATIIDDAELVIDGVTIDDFTASTTLAGEADLVFDVDGDVVIDAGDRVEAELMLRFKSLGVGNEGITVQGKVTSVDADAIDAEGADDLAASQLSGAATGDAHTLRTTGIDVSPESTSAAVTVNDGALNDYATFTVEVEVTAFEQDVYIAIDDTVSLDYDLEDSSGSDYTVPTASSSVVLASTADDDGTYFEITEGETETLTLTVTYTPVVANRAARLVLNSISFAETAVAPTETQTTLPASDYRTSVVTIVN